MALRKTLGVLALLILVTSVFFSSCKKEDLPNPDGGTLSFSTDTVQFDTVFTTLGSTTKAFKAYNPTSSKVIISEIKLAGGQASQFRLNIDGTPTPVVNDVELAAGDSIWIFVEVTVDPQNQNTPFIVADSVMFTTNGATQSVLLVASGQNAHYYYPTQVSDTGLAAISILDCSENIWTNDKPHVIFGSLVVQPGCSLTIEAGTTVYFYKNSNLVISEGATLIVNGTTDNKVVFRGTRLENYLDNAAGQWGTYYQLFDNNGQVFRIPVGGIWLTSGSVNCKIDNAIIKNAYIGLQVDNSPLTLTNTEIYNHTGYGLLGQSATITGYNNVVANCGVYSAALQLGGTYDFRHCTFANYWSDGVRQTPTLLLNNYAGTDVYPLTATFGNSIIYGNVDSELGLDLANGSSPTLGFDKCVMKVDPDLVSALPQLFTNSTINPNSTLKFVSTYDNDYRLDTLATSVAQDAGEINITNQNPPIIKDILGHDRIINSLPDLGAYEKE